MFYFFFPLADKARSSSNCLFQTGARIDSKSLVGPGQFWTRRVQRQNAKKKTKVIEVPFRDGLFVFLFSPGAFVSFVFLLMFLHVPSQTSSSNKFYQFRNRRGHPRSAVLSLFSYKCTDNFCLAPLQWLHKTPPQKKKTRNQTKQDAAHEPECSHVC